MSPTKLLLIHSNVMKSEIFTLNLNADTEYLFVTSEETIDQFRSKLGSIDISGITNIGLLFDNTGDRAPYFEVSTSEWGIYTQQYNEWHINNQNVQQQSQGNTLINEHTISEESSIPPILSPPSFPYSGNFFSDTLIGEILEIKKTATALQFIDILSCNGRYSNEYTTLIDNNIIIRYSTNNMGQNHGFILNSQVNKYTDDNDIITYPIGQINVDAKQLYFSQIPYYPYILAIPGIPPSLPGLITTADDLYNLMATTNPTYLAASYKLGANIDMSIIQTLYPARSIGQSFVSAFLGSFDGDSYTIKIGNVAGSNQYFGLFGNVGSGGAIPTIVIKNINLIYDNSGYSITAPTSLANTVLGGLCGYLLVGNIKDCTVTFTQNTTLSIITTGGSSPKFIGGICGLCIGTPISNRATITNTSVTYNSNITISSSSNNTTGNILLGSMLGAYIGSDISGCSVLVNNDISINCTAASSVRAGLMSGLSDISTNVITNTTTNCNIIVNGNSSLNINTTGIVFSGGIIGFIRGQNNDKSIVKNLFGQFNNTFTVNITSTNNIEFGNISSRVQASNVLNSNISFNIVNINLNTPNTCTYGTLYGLLFQSSNINNNVSIQQSSITIDSPSSNIGCMIGSVSTAVNSILNNTLNFSSDTSFIILSTPSPSYSIIGTIFGSIQTSGNIITNNTVIYSNSVLFQGLLIPNSAINSIIGESVSGNTISNNNMIFNYNSITFDTYPNPPPVIPTGIIQPFGGSLYLAPNTIKTNNYYIDVTTNGNYRIYIYLPTVISIIPPCCVTNDCNKDPQISNYDYSNVYNNKTGTALIKDVDEFYSGIRTGTRTVNPSPIFSSYQDYMLYMQSQNRR